MIFTSTKKIAPSFSSHKETSLLKDSDYICERIRHACEVKKKKALASGNASIEDLKAGMKGIKLKEQYRNYGAKTSANKVE